MNIGWISGALPYLPCSNGFGAYAANLMLRLSRPHRVDLISLLFPADESHLEWSQSRCASVHAIPVGHTSIARRLLNFGSSYMYGRQLHYRRTIQDLLEWGLERRNWDVLHVEGGFMGGLIPPDYPLPKVLSLHDAALLRAQEMLRCQLDSTARLRYLVRRYHEPRYARRVYPRFDRCALVAERDAEFNRRLVPQGKFVAISSGIDTEYYRPLPVPPTPAAMVFHGNLSYPPNVDAALHLANEILPLVQRRIPQATLRLVGASPSVRVKTLASHSSVSLAADLPDLRAALASGEVYACGVRYGSGLKNKLLEAMAMGFPIVCYRSSTSGIDCVHGKHLLVADSAQEFTSHLTGLVRHPEVGRQMAEAARELVVERYSWESCAAQWSALYQQVIDLRKICPGIASANVAAPAVLYN